MIFACTLLIASGIRLIQTRDVQAAASYVSLAEKLPGDSAAVVTEKIGSFWFRNNGGYLYYSPSQNGSYSYAGYVGGSYTNGSKILNISYDGYLQLITCKSGAVKKLKKLPGFVQAGEGDAWRISAIYGKRVYLTRSSFYKGKHWTYLYRLNKKTFKKVRSNCSINESKGKYFVAERKYHTDVSAVPQDLYKSTASGLKKIKTLTKYGLSPKIVGKKIYYASYSDSSMKKATLYRCKLDGTGKKNLGSFQVSGQFSQVYIHSFTSTYCTVNLDGTNYRYIYSTRELI